MADESLSDEELQIQLSAFNINAVITASTRNVYLRKLKSLKGLNELTDTSNSPPTSLTPPQSTTDETQSTNNTQSTNETQSLTDNSFSTSYYGVAISTATPEESGAALSPYYVDKKTLVKALKGVVGARFKKYESPEEAKAFSQQVLPQQLGPKYSVEKVISPLPGVKNKTKEKNKVREFIEQGKMEEFREKIWSNPRFLIGSGDTPEIFHEGPRRNPLHCAVAAGRLEMCCEIMGIIQSDKFWEAIYPHNEVQRKEKDREHLVDLYLNMQDGTDRSLTCETPLHIASKNGHKDIVNYLMSFPSIDTTKRNGEGKTAAEIACSRCQESTDELKNEIQDIINNPPIYYLPVIRSEDNSSPATLGSPCAPGLNSDNLTLINEGCVVSPLIGQAFAGPLSPAKAKELLKEWRSPTCHEDRKRASFIKRSDPDRGLERIGRALSHKEGIGWNEYWDFLGCYCDLSKHDGLQKLETYLSQLKSNNDTISSECIIVPSSQQCNSPLSPLTNGANSNGVVTNSSDDDDDRRNGSEGEGESVLSPKRQLVFLNDEEIKENKEKEEKEREEETNRQEIVVEKGHFEERETNIDSPCESEVPIIKPHPLLNEPRPSLTEQLEAISLNENSSESTLKEYIYQTPVKRSRNHFITGSEPTKLDRDVHLALCDIPIDQSSFPCVFQWKRLVEGYTEDEQKRWHTPRSTRVKQKRPTDSFSPLVFSSPPSSSPSSTRRHIYTNNINLTPQYRRGVTATPTQLLQFNMASQSPQVT